MILAPTSSEEGELHNKQIREASPPFDDNVETNLLFFINLLFSPFSLLLFGYYLTLIYIQKNKLNNSLTLALSISNNTKLFNNQFLQIFQNSSKER